MKRKVIQLAGKTLLLSLPIKWVSEYGVKKGDELDIELRGNEILIKTDKGKKLKKTKLEIEECDDEDVKKIAYLYQKGYDEIEIWYKKKEFFDKLRNKLGDLLGFELIRQGNNYSVIRNITEVHESELNNLIRRVFLINLDLMKGGVDIIKKNSNFSGLKQLIKLEDSNDRVTDLCKRIINKKGYKKHEDTTLIYVVVRDLEKMADAFADFYKDIIRLNKKLSKDIIDLFVNVVDYFELYYNLFYKFNKDNIVEFEKKGKIIDNKINNVKIGKDELSPLNNLNYARLLIKEGYGPVFSINL